MNRGALLLAAFLFACTRETPEKTSPPPLPAASTNEPPSATGDNATEAAGIRYLERLTGGASEKDVLPMVVAIHGLGDRPENFSRLFEGFPGRARFIYPFGEPHRQGFSWFPIDARLDPDTLASGTERAAHRLARMIEALVRNRPTKGKPIITGFSQGGMLSFTLAVLHAEVCGDVFPVAGFLAPRLRPSAWPVGKMEPKLLAFHGDADRVIPIALARDTIVGMKQVGLSAELREYPGVEHSVNPSMRHELWAAIETATRRASDLPPR